jgi:hypothetical protein
VRRIRDRSVLHAGTRGQRKYRSGYVTIGEGAPVARITKALKGQALTPQGFSPPIPGIWAGAPPLRRHPI